MSKFGLTSLYARGSVRSPASDSSSSPTPDTLPDVHDLPSPDSDLEYILSTGNASSSLPSPPASITIESGEERGANYNRTSNRTSAMAAGDMVNRRNSLSSRVALDRLSFPSVDEHEDEDGAEATHKQTTQPRSTDTRVLDSSTSDKLRDLTLRNRKALERFSSLNGRSNRNSLPANTDLARSTLARLSSSSRHSNRSDFASLSTGTSSRDTRRDLPLSVDDLRGSTSSRRNRTISAGGATRPRLDSLLFGATPLMETEPPQRQSFRSIPADSSSRFESAAPALPRRPPSRISASGETLQRRYMNRWMSLDLTSPHDEDELSLSYEKTDSSTGQSISTHHSHFSNTARSSRSERVHLRSATSLGNFSDHPSPNTATHSLRSAKSSVLTFSRSQPTRNTTASASALSPPTSTHSTLRVRNRMVTQREPSGRRSGSGEEQPLEHVKLMAEALAVLETQLSRLPLMSDTPTATVPDVFHDARAVALLLEKTNTMLRSGTSRTLERQVDAEVEEQDSHGIDMGQLWQDVGSDFRDCLRSNDDLVRTMARFFLGTSKILREMSTLHDFESTPLPVGDRDMISSALSVSGASSARSVSRASLDQQSPESLRNQQSTRNLRRDLSKSHLRSPSSDRDVPLPSTPTFTPSRSQISLGRTSPRRQSLGSEGAIPPLPPLLSLSSGSRRDMIKTTENLGRSSTGSRPSSVASVHLQQRRVTAPARTPEPRSKMRQDTLFGALPPSPPTTASPNITPSKRSGSISSRSKSVNFSPTAARTMSSAAHSRARSPSPLRQTNEDTRTTSSTKGRHLLADSKAGAARLSALPSREKHATAGRFSRSTSSAFAG